MLSKKDLVAAVSETTGMTKKESTLAVDTVFATIKDALAKKENVQLIGFGTFSVKERSARKGRNPMTGEEIDIAASFVPSFKASKNLKEAVNG